jgi:hypothetical protein
MNSDSANNKGNRFEPGSAAQKRWLSTLQHDDIVPRGTTIDGQVAGADLPTDDRESYRDSRFVVLYAVPLGIMKSLVYQQVVPSDVYGKTPFFRVTYPRGMSNKYSSETCSMDSQTTACTQQFVTVYKHAFEFLKGTEGPRGNFPLDYEGSHYVMFVPYDNGNSPAAAASALPTMAMNGRGAQQQENLLGLSLKAQDVIIVLLVFVLVLAIYQNQRLHERMERKSNR